MIARGPVNTVIVPIYNEAPYLAPAVEEFIAGLSTRADVGEILLMENGSTDASAHVCDGLAARYPSLVKSFHLSRPNNGAAARAGLAAATGDIIVLLDADFLDHGFLMASIAEVQAGADLVVGSKGHPGAADRRPWQRRLLTRLFRVGLRLSTGYSGSDSRGMKALNRAFLNTVLAKARTNGDAFQTELAVLAWKAGSRMQEVPIDIRETRPSRYTALRQILSAATALITLAVLYRFPRPGEAE